MSDTQKLFDLLALVKKLPGYKGTQPLKTRVKQAIRFCDSHKCEPGLVEKILTENYSEYEKQAQFCQDEAKRRKREKILKAQQRQKELKLG